MRKISQCAFALLIAVQTSNLPSQVIERPAPKFTLTISQKYSGEYRPNSHHVSVIETNISNEEIREGGCFAFQSWFDISVMYNGVPMAETDAVRNLRKIREGHKACNGSLFMQVAQPGGSFERIVNVDTYYDMSKPGTYQIVVTKQTFPTDLQRSVIVKSNPLTITVPEAGAASPN